VAVVGIAGLGHMALQFLNSWGCEITAFSANSEKENDARKLGAHNFLNSRDPVAIKSATNSFDLVLVTANADLDWNAYLNTLKPGDIVGATPPVKADVFALIASERSIGGSPTGSPITIRMMLEFCNRHKISPLVRVSAFSC
jgi:alcohol/geraniol dehydrogenase (NADP+)